MHPLDGIAKRCTDLLKVYDKEYNITSDTFGNAVVQLILCML